MEKKLVILQKNRKRRQLIINSCSLFNIALCAFLVINFFCHFVTGIYFFVGAIILFLVSNFIIHKQKKDARDEKDSLRKDIVSMKQELELLFDLLSGKYEDFENLNVSQFKTEDDLKKEYIKYSQFVFLDVLQKMVDITGVAPEPILLPMNTKEDVERLFSMATEMVTSTLAILHRTEMKLKW